ncbi:MAG: AAA family ATPase [Gemmatimonadota bacterium]
MRDVDAELAVTAAIVEAPALLSPTDVDPDDLMDAPRVIVDAARFLEDRGEPVDRPAVLRVLRSRNGLTRRVAAVLEELGAHTPLSTERAEAFSRRVRELAGRRRVYFAARGALEGERPLSDVARELERAAPAADRDRLVDGGAFIFDGPVDVEPVWGRDREVAAAQGEPTLIVGPDGVAKTTLAERIALAAIGIGPREVLGLPVSSFERVGYVAADRPRQARRSFRRMVGPEDRETLEERLVVWPGPLPFDLVAEPARLAAWAVELGIELLVLDSLGMILAAPSKDESGAAYAQAATACAVAGVELITLYHPRKAQTDNRKPNRLEDVYGSRWITAAAGSVLSLWGDAGDPIVELRHLKQPADPIGPLSLIVDHDAGALEVLSDTDPLAILRAAPAGLSVPELAAIVYPPRPDRSDIEKTRRRLERFVERDLAYRREGDGRQGARPEAATRYFATPPTGVQEPLPDGPDPRHAPVTVLANPQVSPSRTIGPDEGHSARHEPVTDRHAGDVSAGQPVTLPVTPVTGGSRHATPPPFRAGAGGGVSSVDEPGDREALRRRGEEAAS